jgi:hypothetical protein
VRHEPQAFADRTTALLTTHWRAVEALASVLAQERCIEGARIERIIEAA